MTFPRIRAPGLWVLGSVIAPAEMEEVDQHLSEAIDGFAGGVYAPFNRLVIGGAGVDFTGGTADDPLGPLTSIAALGTNASGIYAVGDGTGAGGYFTGGSPAGHGVVGITNNGNALRGRALGTGAGLTVAAANPTIAAAIIGSANANPGLIVGSDLGNALEANGGDTGAGAHLVGGSTSGTGGIAIGGSPNGDGFHIDGTGNGFGLVVRSFGSNVAIRGVASGGGDGGSFAATGSNGRGVLGVGHGSGPGGYFQSQLATGIGVDVATGSLHIATNTSAPGVATGANQLWAGQIVKSTGSALTNGAGGITVTEGVNFTATLDGAAVPPGSQIDITFTTNMASDDYYAGVEIDSGTSSGFIYEISNKSPSGFQVRAASATVPFNYTDDSVLGKTINFSTSVYTINIAVVGRQ